MKKVRLKLRFYVLLVAVIAAIVVPVALLSVNRDPYILTEGTITYDKQFRGVLVRNEKVEGTQEYGKIVMFVAEGERVARNTKIAEVYKGDYSDSVLNQLLDTQRAIMEYQQNDIPALKDVQQPDVEELNQRISDKTQEIQDVIQGKNDKDLLKLEQDLKDFMEERKSLLKSKIPEQAVDQQLQTLYVQEENLLKSMDGWKTDILSKDSGIVSFCFDNAEDLLTPDSMTKLSNSRIEEILRNASQTRVSSAKTTQPLYRLVDNFKWYVLVMGDKKGYPELKADLSFTLSFEGFLEKPYDARVLSVRENEDGLLYTLEIGEDIGALLNARDVRVNLRRDYSGIKIPKSYIRKKDGKEGVNLRDASKQRFVPVEIEMSDDGFVVIRDNELLSVGAWIVR